MNISQMMKLKGDWDTFSQNHPQFVKFLNYMSARHDFVYVVPGEIAHIDNNHENNDAIYMKTFLDMYMLSHSKTIFQLCTGGMYANSAFARQAAILGGVSYNKIVF